MIKVLLWIHFNFIMGQFQFFSETNSIQFFCCLLLQFYFHYQLYQKLFKKSMFLVLVFFQKPSVEKVIFLNFGWVGNIPGLSFFWRPSVVVEQNYPPVHPVMIPGRSPEVYPVRVAIFLKTQE